MSDLWIIREYRDMILIFVWFRMKIHLKNRGVTVLDTVVGFT